MMIFCALMLFRKLVPDQFIVAPCVMSKRPEEKSGFISIITLIAYDFSMSVKKIA